MRKLSVFAVISVFVLASLLAACSAQAPAAPVNSNATSIAATVQALVPATPTRDVVADSVQATVMAMTPSAEVELGSTEVPTMAPTQTTVPATSTQTPQILLKLNTAEDVRNFFKAGTLKWVAGGEGAWTAGAQGALAQDLNFSEMPEGMTVEIQCVQYHNLDGKLIIKEVCPDAEVRFSKTIPADTVVTVWLEWVVRGSADETWKEGFVDKPCLCSDGDCRDE